MIGLNIILVVGTILLVGGQRNFDPKLTSQPTSYPTWVGDATQLAETNMMTDPNMMSDPNKPFMSIPGGPQPDSNQQFMSAPRPGRPLSDPNQPFMSIPRPAGPVRLRASRR